MALWTDRFQVAGHVRVELAGGGGSWWVAWRSAAPVVLVEGRLQGQKFVECEPEA